MPFLPYPQRVTSFYFAAILVAIAATAVITIASEPDELPTMPTSPHVRPLLNTENDVHGYLIEAILFGVSESHEITPCLEVVIELPGDKSAVFTYDRHIYTAEQLASDTLTIPLVDSEGQKAGSVTIRVENGSWTTIHDESKLIIQEDA